MTFIKLRMENDSEVFILLENIIAFGNFYGNCTTIVVKDCENIAVKQTAEEVADIIMKAAKL